MQRFNEEMKNDHGETLIEFYGNTELSNTFFEHKI